MAAVCCGIIVEDALGAGGGLGLLNTDIYFNHSKALDLYNTYTRASLVLSIP